MGNRQSSFVKQKDVSYNELSASIASVFKNCPNPIKNLIIQFIRGSDGIWSLIDANKITLEKLNIRY